MPGHPVIPAQAEENLNSVFDAVESSRAWKELSSALGAGVVPQSVVFCSPLLFHDPFVHLYAHALFSGNGSGWVGENHPDLVRLGTPEAPPGIEACREQLVELYSRPVAANYRLAVIYCADRLSPPAANSLLKIAEEPPPQGRILFLLEEENLLPTLRSRSWILRMPPEEVLAPEAPPKNDDEWVQWLSEASSGKTEALLLRATAWARWYALSGQFRKAADLDTLVVLVQKAKLSTSMAIDLIFLMTREESKFEDFLDSLR
jgi:DNA polymerase-3 subunit delta'